MQSQEKLILIESYRDLQNDSAELLHIILSAKKHLSSTKEIIGQKKKFLQDDVALIVMRSLNEIARQYEDYEKELLNFSRDAEERKTERHFIEVCKTRDLLSARIRVTQALLGPVITSTDYQSPSFLFSKVSLAGRQTGDIQGTINDYKRDQHNDEKVYEQAFLKEYINAKFGLGINIYAVQSGMAALQTIITLLTPFVSGKKILIGKSCYFENKLLLSGYFGASIKEEDEMNVEKFCSAIRRYRPAAIFLDAIGNTPEISYPDLRYILEYIKKNVSYDIAVILDMTSLPLFFQPFDHIKGSRNIRLFVFESLNKYHQFGMDRITGGIIYAKGKDTGKLFYAREHSGTNISDSSAYILPTPQKELLKKRLERFERNGMYLATSLQEFIDTHPQSPFEMIYYPGLSTHPSFSWGKKLPFHGSYFTIAFKKKYKKVQLYQQFITIVIQHAKKENVQIVSGTSFGMNNSRIYLTALRAEITEPFIRFSVGTESLYEMTKIAHVMIRAMTAFSRSFALRLSV